VAPATCRWAVFVLGTRVSKTAPLIGANGAGKSNLIDFFRMQNYAMGRGFQKPCFSDRGPASHILHFGPKRTPVINAELEFTSDQLASGG
jgi:predicted ATPase